MNAMERMAAQENQAVANSWRVDPVIPQRAVDAVKYYDGKPRKGVMGSVVVEVSEKTGITAKQILGRSREKNIARARQLAMWGARQKGVSYQRIGRYFCRDHTTVISNVRVIDRILEGES